MSKPYEPDPPPLVVALVTQKGGSGKTTLAANLAVAATEAGENVVMFDVDPQASLMAWAKDRAAKNAHDIYVAEAANFDPGSVSMLQNMESNDKAITLALLDCPGITSTHTNAAMKCADFCLLPARPSIMDIRAARPTVQTLLTLKRPFAFVLNQCTPGRTTGRMTEGGEALRMMGGLAEPMIGLRADYLDAMRDGQGVTEYAPTGKAAEEMRQLWSWIKAHAQILPEDKDPVPHGAQKKANARGTALTGTGSFVEPTPSSNVRTQFKPS